MKSNRRFISLVKPEIQQLSAYHVPDSTGITIKLDAMENPYRWDSGLTEEWLESLKSVAVNRYPDPNASELKQQLYTVMEIPQSIGMILGNGSDELIQMLALAFNGNERVLLAPEPTFVMYRLIAQIVGMNYVGVPLDSEDFSLDIFAMLEAIESYQPALVFLAYPNNPTGNAFAVEDIEAILETSRGLVVIDEAYSPFAEHSFISYLEQYPNLLIIRTLSKLGLAGLRLGFLIGSPSLLEQIEKTRLPYNINVLSQMTATFALKHYHLFLEQTRKIKEDRDQLLGQLNALANVHAWPSQTNFILLRVKSAEKIFNQLKQQGILIKYLQNQHELLNHCLRVTVGTSEENRAFLHALAELV